MAAEEPKVPRIDLRRKELRRIRISDENYKIAYDFANQIYKAFGNVVLSVILFGSVAKGEAKKESDIDIMIIIDNVSVSWDQDVIAWYREELFKLVKGNPNRDKLHINTMTLSAFWDNVKVGEPAAINILRYGVALLDLGFFEPMKFLLITGRVKPSSEAIYTTLNRAPWHMLRSRVKVLSAVEDIYWAMVDSAHAALMTYGITPPSPEHIDDLLLETFANKKKLDKKYILWYKEIYKLAHDIKNNKVDRIGGNKFDVFNKRASEFVKVMEQLTRDGEKDYLKRESIK